jgi:hypothetical protein
MAFSSQTVASERVPNGQQEESNTGGDQNGVKHGSSPFSSFQGFLWAIRWSWTPEIAEAMTALPVAMANFYLTRQRQHRHQRV